MCSYWTARGKARAPPSTSVECIAPLAQHRHDVIRRLIANLAVQAYLFWKCGGLNFFPIPTAEWRVARVSSLALSSNSMHSRNDELPKTPWEKNKAYAQDPVSQCLVGSLLHRDTPDLTPLRTFPRIHLSDSHNLFIFMWEAT